MTSFFPQNYILPECKPEWNREAITVFSRLLSLMAADKPCPLITTFLSWHRLFWDKDCKIFFWNYYGFFFSISVQKDARKRTTEAKKKIQVGFHLKKVQQTNRKESCSAKRYSPRQFVHMLELNNALCASWWIRNLPFKCILYFVAFYKMQLKPYISTHLNLSLKLYIKMKLLNCFVL